MYAIIETGGKQYRVSEGDELYIEKLSNENGENYEPNSKITFDKVFLIGDENAEAKIGSPYVEGATVSASVIKTARAKKIVVFTYKPKKGQKKKQGHRQPYTKVKIEKIG